MKYKTAEEWRIEAMQRETKIAEAEIFQRRAQAQRHYQNEAIVDADTLADHELYILGKMELVEYEQYLLFKHGSKV